MSINEQPLVTVYIPTFNRLELLRRAVESVRNQTYKNLEIIIVDDCSTDGTQKYLEQLAKEDERVRYFLKEKNSGACVSRNIAIENATGEFITGLDDDDYFLEIRIKNFVNSWKNKAFDSVFVYSINMVKNSDTEFKIPSYLKKKLSKSFISSNDFKIANYCGNQIFIKTENLKFYNGFDINMPAWQDMETWYRILKLSNKKGELIDNISYVYDVSHPHERITRPEKHIKARELFLKKHNISVDDQELFFLINAFDAPVRILIKRLMNQFSLIDLYFFFKKILKNE